MVETMGDLMRTGGGGGGFPKQLAAISTDPIKINERSGLCESKKQPLRRPTALRPRPPRCAPLLPSSRASDRYRPRVVVIAAARGGCREKSGEWMVEAKMKRERERIVRLESIYLYRFIE